jgi:CheY-like chemotaxis protein
LLRARFPKSASGDHPALAAAQHERRRLTKRQQRLTGTACLPAQSRIFSTSDSDQDYILFVPEFAEGVTSFRWDLLGVGVHLLEEKGATVTRILVVDDDRSVAYSVKTLLEYEGFDVVVAEDGHSALAAIEAARYDVVIIDIFMPGMDGLETISAIRRRDLILPIIAISGFTVRDAALPAADVLASAIKCGANCSLNKPFRRKDVLAAVAGCLSGVAA